VAGTGIGRFFDINPMIKPHFRFLLFAVGLVAVYGVVPSISTRAFPHRTIVQMMGMAFVACLGLGFISASLLLGWKQRSRITRWILAILAAFFVLPISFGLAIDLVRFFMNKLR
jgi:hypothetical protein